MTALLLALALFLSAPLPAPAAAAAPSAPARSGEDAPLLPPSPAAAPRQLPGTPAPADRARYEVHLLTMDQGDEVWELFGHNALLIRDLERGEELAWNWGLFDFDQVDFIPRFLRGTMLYTMGPALPGPFLQSYVASNRSIYSHRILLDDAEAAELDAFVRRNFLPENRDYVYHYFLDNCSTRIRDALDQVLGGILEEHFAPRLTERSFRWHARRLVQVSTWVDQGLSFLLGTRGDRPVSEWEAMYVPMELMRLLEGFERSAPGGGTRPLLGPREVLYTAHRPPTPQEPAGFSLLWLGVGLLGALALLVAGHATGTLRSSAGKGALLLLAAGWSALAGVLGWLLVLAWFTDHDFIHRNVNLLYTSPLSLPLVLLLPPALLLTGEVGRRTGALALGTARLVALLALAGSLLQLTPLLGQGNAEVVAVALPVNLALAVALGWSLRRGEAPRPSAPPG